MDELAYTFGSDAFGIRIALNPQATVSRYRHKVNRLDGETP